MPRPRGFPRTIWIGHLQLTPIELLALLGGLVAFANLAWDSPLWDGRLQLLLHLLALAAIGTAAALALRGAPVPRTALQMPLLVLLAVEGLATLLGQNPGLGARAWLSQLTFAALLPVAIVAVARRPQLVALAVLPPTVFLAATVLWQLLSRRLAWFELDVGGLPPIRLPVESTAFGSVAVPPFILLGLLPICLLARPAWFRRGALVVGFVLLLPLAVLSGSRAAWLAMGVAAIVVAAPLLGRVRRPRMRIPRGRWLVAGTGAAVLLGLAVAYAAPRFGALASVVYRERLWQDTLRVWSGSPLLGIGPGTMPYARQAAAEIGLPPVRQPHSHDLALGVLGDAGLLGLAAALALVGVFLWVAGPHRSRTLAGRAASSVLVGFGVSGLVEDLTFLPAFDLICLVLAAMALLDAGAVGWQALAIRPMARLAGGAAVAAALVVAFAGDAASSAFRLGSEAIWAGDWRQAAAWYATAEGLDPWHPAAPKALAVAADGIGDQAAARQAARDAVRLNPGDGASWTNLAWLCLSGHERPCVAQAVAEAVRRSGTTGLELANAAVIEDSLGNAAEADRLYALSLVTNRSTGLGLAWPRPVAPDVGSVATDPNPQPQLTALLAQAVSGEPISVPQDAPQFVRALAQAMRGDVPAARASLQRAMRDERDEPLVWDIASVLLQHWGDDAQHALAVASFFRGGPAPFVAPGRPAVTYEVASLRIYPGDMLVRDAVRLTSVPPWPWVLERFLPTAAP